MARAFKPLSAGNFRKLLKAYAKTGPVDEIALFLQGSNVFGFLKGERGVHKLAARGDGSGEEHARVQAFASRMAPASKPGWPITSRSSTKSSRASARPRPPRNTVSFGRTPWTGPILTSRDMRTSVRLSNVDDVLAKGLLDEFILAYLENEEANVTWENHTTDLPLLIRV